MLLVAVTTMAAAGSSQIKPRKLGRLEKHERWTTRSPGQTAVSDENCSPAGEQHEAREGPGWGVRVLRECASATARL